jgi:hypothetical protein
LIITGFGFVRYPLFFYSPVFPFVGIILVIAIIILLFPWVSKTDSIKQQIIKKPPWKKAISKKKLKITPDSISRLFAYLQNLRILLGWITAAGTLMFIWGLLEFPILVILIDKSTFSGDSIYLLLIPLMKVLIGSLLLIGSNRLMIKPLRTEEFWIKAISER